MMTEREMVEHDARAMALSMPGVRVVTGADGFLAMLDNAERWRAADAADTRSRDEIADEAGTLFQRFLEAQAYGTPEQAKQAADAYGKLMVSPAGRRLYIHAAAVEEGDYIRAVGWAPNGKRDAVTGVVDKVRYTERTVDQFGYGEPARYYGFEFTLTPVPFAGRTTRPYRVWVLESGSPDTLRLPTPVDRGRPAWLDESGTAA